MTSHVPGYIYLVHFDTPLQHARHYMGWTADVTRRLAEHRAGRGARLLQVVTDAGINWELVRVWEGDRFEERRLKKMRMTPRLCPVCCGRALPDLSPYLIAEVASP